MTISIDHPIEATQIFIAILIIALLSTLRRQTKAEPFPLSVTQELKGLAILAIVFAHVGYALVTDNRFLFPISILAGAGVDLFLFLSGYGLVVSGMRRNLSAGEFYRRRLLKLFIPLWISITTFFLLDFFCLQRAYSWGYVVSSCAGIFPSANLSADLNSPLWYFTFILFFYIIFPLVFSKRRPWLSALSVYAAAYLLLWWRPYFLHQVLGFYELHILAFPLGMAVGGYFGRAHGVLVTLRGKMGSALRSLSSWPKNQGSGERLLSWAKSGGHCLLVGALVYVVIYTAYNSGMDKSAMTRQLISLVCVGALTLLFLIKKTEIKLFSWFGLYSYEIYLFHWPILSRYDLFFRSFPAWLALVLYLALFLLLGWGMSKLEKRLTKQLVGS